MARGRRENETWKAMEGWILEVEQVKFWETEQAFNKAGT